MGGASTSSTGIPKAKAGSGAASLRSDSFTVSIPKGMAGEAIKAAKALGITKAQLVKRALADMLEEIEDIHTVNQRHEEKSIPWTKAKAELGL